MDNDKTLYAASLCLAGSLALVWRWRQNRNKAPYPPGPKGYPLIGNILDIPQDVPIWQAFIPMGQKFSECPFDPWLDVIKLKSPPFQDTDVLYLKLLTTDFVVLNSTEAITDLLDKRSNIYSDRVSGPPCDAHTSVLTIAHNGRPAGHPDASAVSPICHSSFSGC